MDSEQNLRHSEELQRLQRILHFPEEVALQLTEVEYELFNLVPPMHYVRQVTIDLAKEAGIRSSSKPNVQCLIQRFNEVSLGESPSLAVILDLNQDLKLQFGCVFQVSGWVTHIIITQPTHEDRKAVLSCILRLALTCYNMGNFNTAVQILAGLK